MKISTKRPRKRPIRALEYGFHHVLRLLPVDLVSDIGALGGRIEARRNPIADHRVRDNLSRLRPDITDSRKFERMVRRFWENAGRCYTEFSALSRIWGSDRITIEGVENLDDARASGRPQIWIFPHLGNWEVIGPTLVDLGYATNGLQITQPLRDQTRRKLVENVRRRYADHMISPGPGSANRIYRRLKTGGVLSIAIDECIDGEVYGPAFGRKPRQDGNLTRTARLAMRTDAMVLIIYAVRRRPANFVIRILPPTPIAFGSLKDEQLAEAATALNAVVEQIILEHIDQWFWLDDLRL